MNAIGQWEVTEKNGKWDVAMIHGDFTGVITCATKADAETVADAGELIPLFYTGETCSRNRVQRCIDALNRNGYGPHYLLTRELMAFAEKCAKSED
jgi:hypothetical protein